MIYEKITYGCKDCDELMQFKSTEEYSKTCTNCGSTNLLLISRHFTSDDTEKRKEKERQEKIINSHYQPKCPTCQSTNIRKIGTLERGASVGMFGLFSKKINKTFKCNNCDYTW